jgi:hypothetical protein
MTAPSPHFTLMTIVGELAFVTILSIVAETGPTAETIVLTFLIGLWLVFLTANAATIKTALTPSN